MGDRAAAGADRPDVHPGRLHRQAVDGSLVQLVRGPANDQRRVEAGAADIGGDDGRQAHLLRQRDGALDSGDGAGHDRLKRPRVGLLERHRAAPGAHDQPGPVEAGRGQTGLEALEVGADHLAHVRVDRGRAGPLVFAKLARGHVRQRHVATESGGTQLLERLELVGGIGVRVQEHDRDGVDAVARELRGDLPNVLTHKGGHDRAAGAHPLAHLEPQPARDERRRCLPEEVVGLGAVSATNLEHIAEPARRQQRHAAGVGLQQRVEPDGRAVHEVVDARQLARAARIPHGVEHAVIRACGRRWALGDADLAALVVQEHEVREGAADVDPQPAHVRPRSAARRSRTPVTHNMSYITWHDRIGGMIPPSGGDGVRRLSHRLRHPPHVAGR